MALIKISHRRLLLPPEERSKVLRFERHGEAEYGGVDTPLSTQLTVVPQMVTPAGRRKEHQFQLSPHSPLPLFVDVKEGEGGRRRVKGSQKLEDHIMRSKKMILVRCFRLPTVFEDT